MLLSKATYNKYIHTDITLTSHIPYFVLLCDVGRYVIKVVIVRHKTLTPVSQQFKYIL